MKVFVVNEDETGFEELSAPVFVSDSRVAAENYIVSEVTSRNAERAAQGLKQEWDLTAFVITELDLKTTEVVGLKKAANWLRRNANAEKEPKARAAFIEAHNAILAMVNART